MALPIHILGKRNHNDVLLYALSTCPKCTRVKHLLKEGGIEFRYIDVDLLDGAEKEKVKNEMRKWNERTPFPMLVIDDEKCIIGDEPDAIKKALGI
jgi:glutaredoxin